MTDVLEPVQVDLMINGQMLDVTGRRLYCLAIGHKQALMRSTNPQQRVFIRRQLLQIIWELHRRYPSRSRTAWRNSIFSAAVESPRSNRSTAAIREEAS